MPLPIQKFREILFQLLYSYDIGQPCEDDMIPLIMKEVSVSKKVVKEAQAKVTLIQDKLSSIDKIITQTCTSYSFERIQSVERNILRIGIYELVFEAGMPPKVAISEAIRLARKFGTPESAAFVNAVLDNVYKTRDGAAKDDRQINRASSALMQSEQILDEITQNPSTLSQDHDHNSPEIDP